MGKASSDRLDELDFLHPDAGDPDIASRGLDFQCAKAADDPCELMELDAMFNGICGSGFPQRPLGRAIITFAAEASAKRQISSSHMFPARLAT